MKAFVTGADGLLGNHLVRELIDNKFSVKVLTQPGVRCPTLRGLPVESVEGDLLDQTARLAGAMTGCDAVFHCAALTNPRADSELIWKVNLEGTWKLLEASLQAGIRKFIHVGSSSSFQFGTREKPGDETEPFPPAYKGFAYMESKHQASRLVQLYAKEKALDASTVAPTFMLGKYDWRPSSGQLIQIFSKNNLWFTSGGGRNFVCAGDVAKAMVAAVEKGKPGETYIAGGENLSYFEFYQKVAFALGNKKPPRVIVPGPLVLSIGAGGSLYGKLAKKQAAIDLDLARLSLCTTYYTAQKAVTELGMPQTPIDEGIADEISGLKEYGHI